MIDWLVGFFVIVLDLVLVFRQAFRLFVSVAYVMVILLRLLRSAGEGAVHFGLVLVHSRTCSRTFVCPRDAFWLVLSRDETWEQPTGGEFS